MLDLADCGLPFVAEECIGTSCKGIKAKLCPFEASVAQQVPSLMWGKKQRDRRTEGETICAFTKRAESKSVLKGFNTTTICFYLQCCFALVQVGEFYLDEMCDRTAQDVQPDGCYVP